MRDVRCTRTLRQGRVCNRLLFRLRIPSGGPFTIETKCSKCYATQTLHIDTKVLGGVLN